MNRVRYYCRCDNEMRPGEVWSDALRQSYAGKGRNNG